MAATAQPAQAPRHPAPGPYGGPHPEDLHQRTRPFFYVQPAQPYMPYQWPIPYNPYCGFPGMGYPPMGFPPFPPSPYVDAPGYIMPHSQLHLVDYRRMMNPHMAPTVAYQARRFRYQHTTNPRVMISSEVQTDPTHGQSPIRSTSNGGPNGPTNCESGRDTCYTGSTSTSTSTSTSSASSTEESTPERTEPVVMAMSQPPTSSTFVGSATPRTTVIQDHVLFQAEEVQIKCNGTVADFKIAHCEETTKLVSDLNGGLLHRNTGAPCLSEGGTTKNPEELKKGVEMRGPASCEAASSEEPCLPPCPDILLTGVSPSTESLPPAEGSAEKPNVPNTDAVNTALTDQTKTIAADTGSSVVACEDFKMVSKDELNNGELNKDDYDLFPSSKNSQFKILHLPFDLQFGELQHLETSVWSVESLMPYVPNSEWLIQNGLMTPQKEPLSPLMEDPMSPTLAAVDSLQERQQTMAEAEPDPHDSMTSLESLPPYLPSASWLADFGNVYLYHKMQPNDRQQLGLHGNVSPDEPSQDLKVGQHVSQSSSGPPSRRREDCSRHKRKTGAASDASDHECQAMSSHGVCLLSPPHQGQCVCNRSFTKRGTATPSPTPSMKRQKHPHPQRDTVKSPGFATCKCLPGRSKFSTKGSGSDVSGRLNEEDTTEGEASENSLRPLAGSKRSSEARKAQHISRHSETCPVAQRPKLREQNCSCDMPKCTHLFSGSREGSGPNQQKESAWRRGVVDPVMSSAERHRVAEQRGVMQKCQPERTWRRPLAFDSESSSKGFNNQKKTPSQSQGGHRKFTRC
ncbi:uncharacterized protein buc2l [Alosa sapidissima]|uniref:uncharacterized protein buc2l n=1 Tax=Alosa sapidissima TaxID=34773 RepID=UPI001C099845|nr:uncharacterized protein buc2l [Alosa sapidissima]